MLNRGLHDYSSENVTLRECRETHKRVEPKAVD